MNRTRRNFPTRAFQVSSALALGIAMAAMQANAAEVFWSAPTNETNSAGDVLTTGTLLDAVFVGCQENTSDCPTPAANDTVNSAVFGYQIGQAGTVGFNGYAGVTLSGVDNPGEFPTPSPGSEDGLVTQGDFSGLNTPMSFVITGLNPGDIYEIQFFEPYWNANYNTTFSDSLGDTITLNTGCSTGCAGTPAVPQYVNGSFTADATSEVITISNPGSYALFAAADVFDESTPEPQTLGMVVAGLFGLAFGRWHIARRTNS
jgi:hypothetical protein